MSDEIKTEPGVPEKPKQQKFLEWAANGVMVAGVLLESATQIAEMFPGNKWLGAIVFVLGMVGRLGLMFGLRKKQAAELKALAMTAQQAADKLGEKS